MTGPQPQPQPQDSAAASPGQPYQLAVALADTPDGQRLAIVAATGPVNITLLLTAAEAKQMAKQMADVAASMSSSGLVVANGASAK